jgi:hypothetical protein
MDEKEPVARLKERRQVGERDKTHIIAAGGAATSWFVGFGWCPSFAA